MKTRKIIYATFKILAFCGFLFLLMACNQSEQFTNPETGITPVAEFGYTNVSQGSIGDATTGVDLHLSDGSFGVLGLSGLSIKDPGYRDATAGESTHTGARFTIVDGKLRIEGFPTTTALILSYVHGGVPHKAKLDEQILTFARIVNIPGGNAQTYVLDSDITTDIASSDASVIAPVFKTGETEEGRAQGSYALVLQQENNVGWTMLKFPDNVKIKECQKSNHENGIENAPAEWVFQCNGVTKTLFDASGDSNFMRLDFSNSDSNPEMEFMISVVMETDATDDIDPTADIVVRTKK